MPVPLLHDAGRRLSTGEEDRGSVAAQPVLGEVQLAHLLLAPQQLLLAQLPHPQDTRHHLDVNQGEQQLDLLHCGRPGLGLPPFLLLEQLLHLRLLLQIWILALAATTQEKLLSHTIHKGPFGNADNNASNLRLKDAYSIATEVPILESTTEDHTE